MTSLSKTAMTSLSKTAQRTNERRRTQRVTTVRPARIVPVTLARLVTASLVIGGTLGLASVGATASSAASSAPVPEFGLNPEGNPLGSISNVSTTCPTNAVTKTCWQYYQPAASFCIPDQVYEFPSDTDLTTEVQNCSNVSWLEGTLGLAASAKVYDVVLANHEDKTSPTGTFQAPTLDPNECGPPCVRLFIDYSEIGATKPPTAGDPTASYSHGHAYVRLMSFNQTYVSDPFAHSPNIKNLTNDTLFAPTGSPNEALTEALDPHLLTYAADTANFAHITEQGPYYVGPGYFNQNGDYINGAYVDVDLSGAAVRFGAPGDDISYGAAYDSDPATCPDATAGPVLATAIDTIFGELGVQPFAPGQSFADANYGYGGCVDAGGGSSQPGIYPFQSPSVQGAGS